MKFYDHAFAVLAGNVPREIRENVKRYFPHTVLLPSDKSLAQPVSHHPDMIFTVIGDSLLTHERYYHGGGADAVDEICRLGGFRLVLCKGERGADYPRDVGFNALTVGNSLLGRTDALSEEVLTLAKARGMEAVHVKQGYTACSALYVPSLNLICTADKGIASACERLDAVVVPIPPHSGITLTGYDEGFIGGCTGAWEDAVFFLGNPRKHPSLMPMCESLKQNGVKIIPLSNDTLTDCGGIRIFPIEKENVGEGFFDMQEAKKSPA